MKKSDMLKAAKLRLWDGKRHHKGDASAYRATIMQPCPSGAGSAKAVEVECTTFVCIALSIVQNEEWQRKYAQNPDTEEALASVRNLQQLRSEVVSNINGYSFVEAYLEERRSWWQKLLRIYNTDREVQDFRHDLVNRLIRQHVKNGD